MPIAGASRAAVSCGFGFLNVLLLTGSKQALMNREASGLKSLTVKFHPLLRFSQPPETGSHWNLIAGRERAAHLHRCIWEQERKSQRRDSRWHIKANNRSRKAPSDVNNILLIVSAAQNISLQLDYSHGSAQHEGFVPISSSWLGWNA